MAYTNHYVLADGVITHLNGVVAGITDPFLVSRYVGFVSVSAVTVYELAVKEIFISFGDKKHQILGEFTRNYFERLNGRIKKSNLDDYLKLFGDKYVVRFKKKLDVAEKHSLRFTGESIVTSYGNIVTWRHRFAHEGQIPSTPTFNEVTRAYELGKEVINCLAETLKR